MADIKPEDIKHDDNPDANEAEVDFGNALLPDDPAGEEVEEVEEEVAPPTAAKGRKNGNASKPAGKAPAAAAAQAAGDEAGEVEPDGAGGDGDAVAVDGEDDEESVRAAGAAARRLAESGNRAGWVPPHRLREATQAARAAETRVRELEAEAARLAGAGKHVDPVAPLEAKLDGLYEKVEEARAEGRSAEAAKMQREIDGINREISGVQASRVATASALEIAQTAAYETTVDEIEAKFPELNPDNEKLYDGELAQEVLELAAGFRATKKMTHAAALKRALSYVFREDFLDTGTAHLYADPKKGAAAVTPDKKVDLKAATDAASARKGAQVKANLAVSSRQPAPLGDAGKSQGDVAKYDVKNMSESEWDALPESTRARLRGDFIGA